MTYDTGGHMGLQLIVFVGALVVLLGVLAWGPEEPRPDKSE
ncbi:hypothetical protein [Parasphingorhabdus pacifica]